jgi:hypothetical protein
VLSIPIGEEGVAGEVRTVASGLPLVDDLAFTGDGDTLLAALNRLNEVALVQADGSHTTVLTGEDGLQSPTSIAGVGRPGVRRERKVQHQHRPEPAASHAGRLTGPAAVKVD